MGRSKPGETTLETETLKPLRSFVSAEHPRVPALTLLSHPDPGRIGEQARLHLLAGGGKALLSRLEPELRSPGSATARPLADPYLSRRPISLERFEGGVAIDPDPSLADSVLLDGEPLVSRAAVAEERLEVGVVLELSGRVALLLHLVGMERGPRSSLGLVGASDAIEVVREELRRAASSDLPVLLRGESGTGKELAALAIHERSPRRERPYLCANMAAVPATTAASELFGHVRGAFTGATGDREGLFSKADGGTLFLDEVGDTPADVQVMLLRTLETGELQPVGGPVGRTVDVRLVTASESDLEAAVEAGSFRLAFLHRIAGYEISLPPLRERRDDVPRLLVHFLRESFERSGRGHLLEAPLDRRARALLPASLVSRLVRHPWPGNVRQLRNVSRLLALTAEEGSVLQCTPAVERALGRTLPAAEEEAPARRQDARPPTARRLSPAKIGEEELREALRATGFRPGRAAKLLGIGRTSIYRLIDEAESVRKAEEIPEDELRQALAEHGDDLAALSGALEVSERSLKIRLKKLGLA